MTSAAYFYNQQPVIIHEPEEIGPLHCFSQEQLEECVTYTNDYEEYFSWRNKEVFFRSDLQFDLQSSSLLTLLIKGYSMRTGNHVE